MRAVRTLYSRCMRAVSTLQHLLARRNTPVTLILVLSPT